MKILGFVFVQKPNVSEHVNKYLRHLGLSDRLIKLKKGSTKRKKKTVDVAYYTVLHNVILHVHLFNTHYWLN